jgi:hypothetical protein
MQVDEIPQQVRDFLSQCVGTLDELGILLALMGSTTRWWNAKAVGDELGVSEIRARRSLESLASRNLLDIKVSDDVRYQFRPGTQVLEARASALLKLYRERPAIVLRWAAGLGGTNLTDFADAFRFWK